MPPIRIAAIGHPYVVESNRALMRELASLGEFDITIIAPEKFRGDFGSIPVEPAKGNAYRLQTRKAKLDRLIHLFWFHRLSEHLAPGQFDLIWSWEEPYVVSGFQIARAAVAAQTPFVFHTNQNLDKRYPPPFSWMERYCVRHAAGWAGCGYTVVEAMASRNYPMDRGIVLPLAVSERRFFPDEDARSQTRKELGFDGPVIGFVGRLVPPKGLAVLMRALESVPQPWNLLVVGSGPEEGILRDWARGRGIQSKVAIVRASHDDVPRYLRSMDVLAVPSQTTRRWKEQFGRVITEAFACGVAVVGSDSGEIPHTIENAGLVCPEQSISEWSVALNRVLSNPDLRNRLREAGLARFKAQYSGAAAARRCAEFIREVLAIRQAA